MRNKISLSGNWTFRVPGGPLETRKVPGSYYMSGDTEYSRAFDLDPEEGRRYLLVFEGIHYGGHAKLNGVELDQMLPYSEYRFDVTDLLRPGQNQITVYLRDLGLDFGPSLGWRNYAGIVRDVYILSLEQSYVEDVFFRCRLSDQYTSAQCTAEITLANTPDGTPVSAVLSGFGSETSACGICSGNKVTLTLDVKNPSLWSVDHPNLYTLTVAVENDRFPMQVGIREFQIRGNQFFLNGFPCFLAGVCRHDMQTDACGFTQTDEQIERIFP